MHHAPLLPPVARTKLKPHTSHCSAGSILRELWGMGGANPSPFQGPGLPIRSSTTQRLFEKHHVVHGTDACMLVGKDHSAVLLRQRLQGTEGWQAWPMPLRLPLGAEPGWVARNWRDLGLVEAFQNLPPCARSWDDVAAGNAPLPWWPLANGWGHLPNPPVWAPDPRTPLSHLVQVALHVADTLGYSPFEWRIQIESAQVLSDGALQAPEARCTLRGTGPNKTVHQTFEAALLRAVQALVGELRAEVADPWFLNSWLSHGPDGDERITMGTVASVCAKCDTPRVGGHGFLAACAALPPTVAHHLLALGS
jgi:hypothetical protein